ncbi:MAG: FAD binding domain-containing protein [Pseudomonadota bacterium]
MNPIKNVFHPTSVEEAYALKKEHSETSAYVSGCTSLYFSRSAKIEQLINLKKIPMKEIGIFDDSIEIGANVTANEIYKSQLLKKEELQLLIDAGCFIGTNQLRNAITIGGNLAQIFSWSDLPVALMALDALVEVFDGTLKKMCILDFIENPAGDYGIITKVIIPRVSSKIKTKFIKFAKTKNDYAIFTSAILLDSDENSKIRKIRVVVGGCTAKPVRCRSCEDTIIANGLGVANIEKASLRAKEEVQTLSDFRANAEYRKELIQVYVKRTLEEFSNEN